MFGFRASLATRVGKTPLLMASEALTPMPLTAMGATRRLLVAMKDDNITCLGQKQVF